MAQVFLISDYAAVGNFEDVPDTAIVLTPSIYLFAILAVGCVGLLVGAVELLFLNRRFAHRSLRVKLVGKTGFYMLFLLTVMLVTFPIAAAMEMGVSLVDRRVWERLTGFLFSTTGLGTSVQLTTSLVLSVFYAEISEHMGPRVLTNFLSGRYHTPKQERRVFLFSDMKESTRIAEALGNERYFEFLRAYYDALADAIVDHGGEVYQYIGDEIVVSWREAVGVRDALCLRCVARMKSDLAMQASRFLSAFGEAPDFRAGLQIGPVTTGEIGALKREIVFSGDILNQTARIQGLAKGSPFDVVVGGELASLMGPAAAPTLHPLGEVALRGREEKVEIFGFDPEAWALR